MKKGVLLGLPLLMLLCPLMLLVLGTGNASIEAVYDCRNQTDQGIAPNELGDLGDLGDIDGPIGGPVRGDIGVASANIPNRSRLGGFRVSMPKVLSTNPDFVSLNEISDRSLAQIEAAAPGYSAYRRPVPTRGPGAKQSMGNAVLWKHDVWTKRNAGRVKIVEDDQTYYSGRRVTWDRFATWALLERRSDGAVVSIISTHHMTNPQRFPRQHGSPPLTRTQQYGAGMDILLQLRTSLATHGPVLVAGDMNSHPGQADRPWSAAAKMKAAGYGWHHHAVDFVFFPRDQGATLVKGWTGRMISDHQWVAARIAMNGAGPTAATAEAAGVVQVAATSNSAAGTEPGGAVFTQLMRLGLADSLPTLTRQQARNAITIARVARDLKVPKYGLQVALAAAIQESKLVNLTGGDRDSGGLFQQRPSQGWGSRAQITNPVRAARAFFGQAPHTSNPGLFDIPGWSRRPLAQAAQAVQRSGYPEAYAQWEDVAGDIAAVLGGGLSDLLDDEAASAASTCPQHDTVASITLGTLNILGAGHTDRRAGGGLERPGYAPWGKRLPGVMSAIERAGVTIAGLQEVHGPQAKALAERYSAQWGMYPATGNAQNKVIWDRGSWEMTDSRLVQIPYFNGKEVGMPVVQLTGVADSINAGQVIWVWNIHNPANSRGNAAALRKAALRRQLTTMTRLASSGTPVVILGDFNDGKDGQNASHCALTPELVNAFGGSADPCEKPKNDAPIDHIYGANLSWASARVDNGTQVNKVADHPLVLATTTGSTLGCAAGTGDYHLGPVTPELERVVNILGPMFDIKTVGGYRESARDPQGHPSGLAADFMVPLTTAGRAQGDRLAAYAREHAHQLGVDYIIWYQRIWSTDRAAEGWRPMVGRGGASQNHLDHVHLNVKHLVGAEVTSGPSGQCDEVVYPVPAVYRANDARNWHEYSDKRFSWHTGTDISAHCGTPVYAAHGGTIQVDTTQGWSGPWLVKVTSGPGSLTTWYGHMKRLTVSRGEAVQPGQQIGMVGEEGNSYGCHLHFEVHQRSGSNYGPDNVDPSGWLDQHVPAKAA